MRPALTMAAWEGFDHTIDAESPVLWPAAALELVHNYSLIHDDLPAMDDDELRRGRPTVHVAFDEASAILAGDALLTEAFFLLAQAPLAAEQRIKMVEILSAAAGYRGMVGGQAGDIHPPDAHADTVMRIHDLKTGQLITAAVLLGGLAAEVDGEALEKLKTYGACVGLAFQLADDLLDEEEDAGPDGPPSLVKAMGAKATKAYAFELVDQAAHAVEDLPRPAALLALARFVVTRSY